jgi:hypothetical protein
MSTTISSTTNAFVAPLAANQRGRVDLALGPDRWLKPPCWFGLWVHGRVDAGALGQALTLIARRHAALRVQIDPVGMRTICHAPADWTWPLLVSDLRGLPAAGRDAALQAELDRLRMPFPLDVAPLTRAVLIHVDASRSLLAVAVDHIVFDGGSVPPFLSELERFYEAAVLGSAHAESPPASNFVEFGARESDWLTSSDGRAGLAYWSRHWPRNGPFSTGPLLDRPGAVQAATAGTWVRHLSDPELAEGCARLGLRRSVSPFVLLVSALTRALRRYSDSASWGAVYPISRRVRPGDRRALGYFNNRLYLGLPRDEGTFGGLMAEVQNRTTRGLQHGLVPFEELLRQHAPQWYDRRPDQPYLFVNVVKDPLPPMLGGARTEFTWLPRAATPTSMHGISLTCQIMPDQGLRVNAVHDRTRVDATALTQVLADATDIMLGRGLTR